MTSSTAIAGEAFRTIRQDLPPQVDYVWSPRHWALVVPAAADPEQVAAAQREVAALLASAS